MSSSADPIPPPFLGHSGRAGGPTADFEGERPAQEPTELGRVDETFDHAVAEYADLTERDHNVHLSAIDSGRVAATDDID